MTITPVLQRPIAEDYSRRLALAIGLMVVLALFLLIQKPHFGLIFQQSFAIQIHLFAAVGAFSLGGVLLAWKKGRAFHRAAGWTWVLMTGVLTIASVFIRTSGHFSWIHILSATTAILLPLGVLAARRHNVKAHRKTMTLLYLGGLIIAGGFTFVPGRLMWQVFFS